MDRLPVKAPLPHPTWRKPFGILLILALIAAWAVAVAAVADLFPGAPWPLRAAYFIVCGLVWIAPLKPLLRWMETGRWRRGDG
jgi:predicted membrane channel-forming protein YqfA (hemolysin III family)